MSKKLKQIVAIIALIFMGIFTVSFILWLINSNFLNGQIGFLTLFSGGIGIALFFVIKFSKDYSEKPQAKPEDNVSQGDNTNNKETDNSSDNNTNKVANKNKGNKNDK